jgi:hypothetical protein
MGTFRETVGLQSVLTPANIAVSEPLRPSIRSSPSPPCNSSSPLFRSIPSLPAPPSIMSFPLSPSSSSSPLPPSKASSPPCPSAHNTRGYRRSEVFLLIHLFYFLIYRAGLTNRSRIHDQARRKFGLSNSLPCRGHLWKRHVNGAMRHFINRGSLKNPRFTNSLSNTKTSRHCIGNNAKCVGRRLFRVFKRSTR